MQGKDSTSGPLPREIFSPGAVLLDNSTYFSAKVAMTEKVVDPFALYNLGILLEALVLADELKVSPALNWRPDASDTLFSAGPLSQIGLDTWPADELADMMLNAVDYALRDVGRVEVAQELQCSREDRISARAELVAWRTNLLRAPGEFISQFYSSTVYWSDPASKMILSRLDSSFAETLPRSHHLAHFLVRSHMAVEFSAFLAYHPHSHRLGIAARRMEQSIDLSTALVRSAELLIKRRVDEIQERSWLAQLQPIRHRRADLPLVLAAVLASATDPDSMIPIALELRDSASARRFRGFTRELLEATRDDDLARQAAAAADLEDAEQVLARELRASLGSKMSKIDRAADFISIVDVTEFASKRVAQEAVRQGIGALKKFPEWRRTYGLKRRVMLLLELANRTRRLGSMNPALGSVFGRQLSVEELGAFERLRADQSAAIRRLRGRVARSSPGSSGAGAIRPPGP